MWSWVLMLGCHFHFKCLFHTSSTHRSHSSIWQARVTSDRKTHVVLYFCYFLCASVCRLVLTSRVHTEMRWTNEVKGDLEAPAPTYRDQQMLDDFQTLLWMKSSQGLGFKTSFGCSGCNWSQWWWKSTGTKEQIYLEYLRDRHKDEDCTQQCKNNKKTKNIIHVKTHLMWKHKSRLFF